jgi:hypothetical protein
MAEVKLPNGMTIVTYPPAPTGFDPLQADAKSLAHYGLLPRPSANPELLQRWERFMKRTQNFSRIEPSFRCEPTAKALSTTLDKKELTGAQNPNLCGAVVNPPAGSYLQYASASWTVPRCRARGNSPGATFNCAISVALQLGTLAFSAGVEVSGIDDGPAEVYAFTILSSAAAETVVQNFAISAGDTVKVSIGVNDDLRSVYVTFTNNTDRTQTAPFSIPIPEQFMPQAAEWLIATVSVAGAQQPLPFAQFGQLVFTNASALTQGLQSVNPLHGKALDLVQNQITLATATLADGIVICISS